MNRHSSCAQSKCALNSICPTLRSPFAGKASYIFTGSPMAKTPAEIDIRNPFTPSYSPAVRPVETALLFCVALFGLAAAAAALVHHYGVLQ